MSAVPESTRGIPRLRRRVDDAPDLSDPSGLEDVERMMDRLIGSSDHAGRMGREHVVAGGKRLRARLALAAGEALAAPLGDAVAWATAVELLHNATLVHDDIQDGDRTRRGRPTLWTVHGTAQAINAGDMMLMLPYLAIAETSSHANAELCRVMAEHAVYTVRGQIAEIDLCRTVRSRGTTTSSPSRARRGRSCRCRCTARPCSPAARRSRPEVSAPPSCRSASCFSSKTTCSTSMATKVASVAPAICTRGRSARWSSLTSHVGRWIDHGCWSC